MDCATFRRQHTAFVDGVINDADLVSMQRHISECASCAAHDVAVRRALVVFRSLPPIEPSPDFADRLHGQLWRARTERRRAFWPGRSVYGGPGIRVFAAATSGVIAAGFLIVSSFGWGRSISALTFPPMMASAPLNAAPAVSPTATVRATLASSVRATRAAVSRSRLAAAAPENAPAATPRDGLTLVGNQPFGRSLTEEEWAARLGPNLDSLVSSSMAAWSDPALAAPAFVERAAPRLELTNLRR